MIADDDADILELLVLKLRAEGHTVTTVSGGRAAWEAFRHDAFDLAILDVGMPEASGIDVLRSLREHPDTAGLPVVLLSAWASADDIGRGLAAGASEYVTKPFRLTALSDCVSGLLAARPTPSP